ncbi:MAG: response regulator transcription factor [Anaerolineae bacterium]
MNRIRALLVGENNIVLAGLRALLEKMKVRIVGKTSACTDCLEEIRQIDPTLVLMYVETLRIDDIDRLAQIRAEFPGVQVIALSHFANKESVLAVVKTGISGYLPLDADPKELELCLRAVNKGQNYLSPYISRHVLSEYQRNGERALEKSERPENSLTARQIQVLRLIVKGHTTHELAHQLSISVKTVETHRANLMERLNIHDIPGLVRYAIRNGLIGSEQES